MNANATKWVEALRSGEFEQARGWLRAGKDGKDAYCCLGVACVVYQRETKDGEWRGPYCFAAAGGMDSTCVLPDAVLTWIGLQGPDGYFRDEAGELLSLSCVNDRGASFQEIADLIEAEPLGLFS